jgi:hypothetical protein
MHEEDCGCGGKSVQSDFALELGDIGEPPSLQEMELALSQLGADTDGFELDLADLESALEEAESPLLGDEAELPGLRNILAIAERYPGLKITFSF